MMKEARHGRRRAEKRHRNLLPENAGRHIDFADVDKKPRHELVLIEPLGIPPHRPLVPGRTVDVVKHRGRHTFRGPLAQTRDVVAAIEWFRKHGNR